MATTIEMVEVAFDSDRATPAASRTWTDVTSYVVDVEAAEVVTVTEVGAA